MNCKELKIEMIRHGFTVGEMAKIIGVGRKAYYMKSCGKTEFKLSEILALKKALELSDERVAEIFFAE